jgi:hypothetical protein
LDQPLNMVLHFPKWSHGPDFGIERGAAVDREFGR